MANYELILIIDPDLPDDRRQEIIDSTRKTIESGSSSVTTDESWGTRRLAYEIDRRREAIYHLFGFDGNTNLLNELSRTLKITEGVLRYRLLRSKPCSKPVSEASHGSTDSTDQADAARL